MGQKRRYSFLKPSLNWLTVFFPIAIGLHYVKPEAHTYSFIAACLAVIPLAGLMGRATEHLADKAGEGIGGLLNATFGNAAELIIAFMALQKGMVDVVKASLTGSIIGNILLVMGAAFLGGGLKHQSQRFNPVAARAQSSMLTLAAIALILPAAYHHLAGAQASLHETDLSLEISVVLLATYALGLVFSLHTHKHLFTRHSGDSDAIEGRREKSWSAGKSIGVLALATVAVGWVSEVLVGSVEGAAHDFGMSGVFVGVIVVAVIGNAAEHSTAVLAALNDRMDLGIGIALGSSIQIALFVAPVLVILGKVAAPVPMDLVFSLPEVLAVVISVAIAGQVSSDGESNWLEGVQLLSVYLILAAVFYFLPG